MSNSASLSETLNRLLPGEQWKRVREAILQGANYSGERTDQLRRSIDEANRLRTGLLVNGITDILTDTSAELKLYVWVIDFAVKQPAGVTALVIDAPEASFARDDYFLGLEDETIVYRPGTVDALGNSFPPEYDAATEVILRIVRRNPDGTNVEVEVPEGNNLIDFAEQNIIPFVAGGKLKNSGIQVLFDALGAIAAFKFPTPVKGKPAQNPDEFVTLSQLPATKQYGRLSGGTIQWSGSGLTYNFSQAFLAINGDATALSGQVTLDAADPVHDRFDGLGWRKIAEGIADRIKIRRPSLPDLSFPQFDPETEVEGIFVSVPALATVPDGVTTENIYLDNAPEWAVSFSGTGTGNADSTASPKDGTKAVETTATRGGFKTTFDRGSVFDLNTLTEGTIGWDQKLKAILANNQNFDIIFLDGSGNAASNLLTVAINKATTAYQFLGVNLLDFTFSTKLVRYFEIRYRQPGSGTHAGSFFDNVKLQGGVTQPPSNGSGVQSVTGDGVGGTAANPVLTFPTPVQIGAQVALDANIVNALNASLVDSPGTLNRYVSVSLLNSYAYVQEAPINGNHYARKDGVWAAFTPFAVAGTPTDGHMVTSVAGVPTWQAPSGGGSSLWTDGGGFIYRDGPVQIGKTTATDGGSTNNVTFLIQSKFSGSYTYQKWLANDGDLHFEIANTGVSRWYKAVGYGRAPFANITLTTQSFGASGAAFFAYNDAGTLVFQIQNAFTRTDQPFGLFGNPLSNFSMTIRTNNAGGGPLLFYNFAGALSAMVDNPMNWRSVGGAYFGRQAAPSGMVNIRGGGTGTANTLLLENSAGTNTFRFRDNGQLFAYNLTTTTPTAGTKEVYVDGSGFLKLA